MEFCHSESVVSLTQGVGTMAPFYSLGTISVPNSCFCLISVMLEVGQCLNWNKRLVPVLQLCSRLQKNSLQSPELEVILNER